MTDTQAALVAAIAEVWCSTAWHFPWEARRKPCAECLRCAAALVASPALREYAAGVRAEVGEAVATWAAKNEIAAPPLDWAWLGEITAWARATTTEGA